MLEISHHFRADKLLTRGVLLPFFHTPYKNRFHKTAYDQTLDPLIDELRYSQKTSLPSAKPSSAHCLLFANQPVRLVASLHCVFRLVVICWLILIANTSPATQQTIDGKLIGSYLQQQYTINDAVFLTQQAWQLSHSFASEEQLLSQWQDVLEQVEKKPQANHQAFPKINSHATAGQLLIQYSNGMDLQLWRITDLPTTEEFSATAPILAAEKFQLYLNLPGLWQKLFKSTQNKAKWLTWTDTISGPKTESNPQPLLTKVLQAVQTQANLKAQLKTIATEQDFDLLQTAILRQQYHKNHHQLLAYGYDWIEIYQLLETGTWLLSAEQQQQMQQLITANNDWWTSQRQVVDLIDQDIFSVIEQISQELPKKFKNPDHINPQLNQQLFKILFDLDDATSYFNAPARQQLQQNLEICLNLSAEQVPNPQQPINQKQFQSCITDLVRWAEKTAKNVALAGPAKFTDDKFKAHLRLTKPSYQNINLLQQQLLIDDSCRQQLQTKANPLEWILAAESLGWFADRWPGLIAELKDKQDFNNLKQQGQQLFAYPQCVQAKQVLNSRFQALAKAWQKLQQSIRQTIADYRQQHLIQGSQIDFFAGNEQAIMANRHQTAIAPCDLAQSCGAFVELPTSDKLFEFFPNHLKMAEQFAMGELKICYDRVKWVNRQTAPTHLNNDKITNYTGQLSIQINGKYNDQTIFSKTITGEQRYLYLFAANTQQVMEMGCPVPIVGKEINTKLDRGTLGLFPNRLTFLTAQRTDINSVLENNWQQGENWLAKLTDNNHTALSMVDNKAELKSTVNQTFRKHSNQLQQQIYNLITAPKQSEQLSMAALNYFNQRQLLAAQIKAIFPDLFLQPQIRQALNGTERLPDQAYFKQHFSQQSNLLEILSQAQQRLNKHQQIWQNTTTPNNSILPQATRQQL